VYFIDRLIKGIRTMAVQDIFGALSDPTRFAIVERLLTGGDLTAGELAEPFDISKPAISRHLRILEDSGVIERRVDRQFRVFRARPEGLREMDAWLSRYRRFWSQSFDRLDRYFKEKGPRDGDGN
jgi:DNA-binding transcriptional ArsR family regulator